MLTYKHSLLSMHHSKFGEVVNKSTVILGRESCYRGNAELYRTSFPATTTCFVCQRQKRDFALRVSRDARCINIRNPLNDNNLAHTDHFSPAMERSFIKMALSLVVAGYITAIYLLFGHYGVAIRHSETKYAAIPESQLYANTSGVQDFPWDKVRYTIHVFCKHQLTSFKVPSLEHLEWQACYTSFQCARLSVRQSPTWKSSCSFSSLGSAEPCRAIGS